MEPQNLVITVGCHIELNLLDRNGLKESLSVDIVVDESADFRKGFLGSGTPLGRILLGEKAGSVIPYLKDDILAIEILTVTPSIITPDENLDKKRRENLEQALREVEHTNAVIFASSFTGKWGDYDPDSLPDKETPTEDEAME